MSKRVLITGGAGYVGSILTPMLLSEGHKVTVIDNFFYDQVSLMDCCGNENFSIIRGDCRDPEILGPALKDADFIMPLAAMVGAKICYDDKTAAETLNFGAIELLLKLRSQEQKIIFPCTNSGYGIGEKDAYCTEESPLNPISVYGTTKVAAEKAVLAAGNSISLRFATLFGASPKMRLDLLVNDFMHKAVTEKAVVVFEGKFRRNYLHVRDAARVFVHALNNFDSMKNEAYNVGLSSANLTKLELCAEIKKVVPDFTYLESAIGQDPDKRDYFVSNDKIEKTGFKAIYDIPFGLNELLKAYQIVYDSKFRNY